MSKRILLSSLFCGLLAISAGCQVACWPYGGTGGDPDLNWGPGSHTCDSEPGGAGDCGGCGLLGRCRARRACVEDSGECGRCGPVRGTACGDPCETACPRRPIVGPLSWLAGIFTRDSYWGGSCSSYRYWGDFYGDPPDINDPCDNCGNFTGRGYQSGGCQSGDCQGGGMVRRGGCPTCGNQDYAGVSESPRPAKVAARKVSSQPATRQVNPQTVNRNVDPRRSAAATATRRTGGNLQPAPAPTMTVVGDRVVRAPVASENDPIVATKIISETDRVVSTTTESVAEGPQPRPAVRR
jgi:hypothetical protein